MPSELEKQLRAGRLALSIAACVLGLALPACVSNEHQLSVGLHALTAQEFRDEVVGRTMVQTSSLPGHTFSYAYCPDGQLRMFGGRYPREISEYLLGEDGVACERFSGVVRSCARFYRDERDGLLAQNVSSNGADEPIHPMSIIDENGCR